MSSDELGRALAAHGPMRLGDVPAFSIVAWRPDSDPQWWMLVLSAPHPRRYSVKVLSDAVTEHGHRIEVEYRRDLEVWVITSPADLGLAMLYDAPMQQAYQDHTDSHVWLRWQYGEVRTLDLTSGADTDSADSTSAENSTSE